MPKIKELRRLVIGRWAEPTWWIIAVPLWAVLAACGWGYTAEQHPGIQPSRGAGAVLVLGCVMALVLCRRPVHEGGWQTCWRSPVPWLVAALTWQAAIWWWMAPVREPGLLWWGERAGALVLAVGLAGWCRGVSSAYLLIALTWSAALLLTCSAITATSHWQSWWGGQSVPFGNPNFCAGAAVPLLGCAAWAINARSSAHEILRRWTLIGAAVGMVAAVLHGMPWLTGAMTRAVWLSLAAMIGLWVILRLPARSQGWIVGLGEVAVIVGIVALIAGAVTVPDGSSPSTGYRVALWQCAWEAICQHPWTGMGVGSTIVTLQEQATSPVAWMWVPSYAEHAHNEYLQALLDGGVVGGLLLAAAVLATVAPLWRRRADPMAAGLLIAWAGVLTHALVESHLSQPGPLLMLALLAGVTWAWVADAAVPVVADQPVSTTSSVAGSALRVISAIGIAALLFAQCWRDLTDGGSPTMIEFRAQQALKATTDHAQQARIAAEVRQRLGDLDCWLSVEAVARARSLDNEQARSLAVLQLVRLPTDAAAFDLVRRYRDLARTKQDYAQAMQLDRLLTMSQERVAEIRRRVPENDKNREPRVRWDLAATRK